VCTDITLINGSIAVRKSNSGRIS